MNCPTGERDHHLPGPIPCKVDHRALSGENTSHRKRHGGGEARIPRAYQAWVGGFHNIRGLEPTGGHWPILRTSGRRRLRLHGCCDAASQPRPRCRQRTFIRNPKIAHAVDQSRINREAIALNHPGVRRYGDVFTHRFNQSIPPNHSSVCQHGSVHRHHPRVPHRHCRRNLR